MRYRAATAYANFLVPGTYVVRVEAAGWEVVEREVTIGAGAETLRLLLRRR